MAGNYDPLRDVARLLSAAMQTAGSAPRVVADPLLKLGARLGFDHRTDPSEIEDKLRGTIERRVRREMAREVLALDAVDGQCARNVGPWGCMDASLKRIERGVALPDWRELHGGEGAEHG
jgi:hypothetical protein